MIMLMMKMLILHRFDKQNNDVDNEHSYGNTIIKPMLFLLRLIKIFVLKRPIRRLKIFPLYRKSIEHFFCLLLAIL